MLTLAAATEAVATARAAADPAALAAALCAFAELTPLFRYRAAPARAALEEASALLPPLADRKLEARCLLRLAEVLLCDGSIDGAAEAASHAEARAAEAKDDEAVFRARCLQVRVLHRKGESQAALAALATASTTIAAADLQRAGGRSFAALMLAVGDGQVEACDPAGVATLKALLRAIDREDRATQAGLIDARFAAHQGVALLSQLGGEQTQALIHLRAALDLVKAFPDAELDLLECRLALGTALSAAQRLDEARRVLQVVVDSARDLGAEPLRLLGLSGLATVLSQRGAVQGAVDLALAAADGYASGRHLGGYVRSVTLAAHVYLSHGREAAGLELLLYGASALRHTVGESAANLLQMQIDALRAEWGEARYEAVCQDLLDARAARQRLAQE